ncbi:hypothetical protein [Jiella sp. M17.18]|uniref:hypothetical protein n=1 Tax=Jiella sp. M17.18 TaxID=3234247 RepID=UPI0034DF50E6
MRLRTSFDFGAAGDDLRHYWTIYGGWAAVYRSPIFWMSILSAALCWPLLDDGAWHSAVFSIVPTVMAFTLSSMAIILALPASPLFRVFAEEGRDDSYFLDLTSKLVHFVFIQTVCLLLGLIGRAHDCFPLNFFGLAALFYVVFTGALMALSFYGMARLFNRSEKVKNKTQRDQ